MEEGKSYADSPLEARKNACFEYGVVKCILVSGEVCHESPSILGLVTETPERERSRVAFMKEWVSKNTHFLSPEWLVFKLDHTLGGRGGLITFSWGPD